MSERTGRRLSRREAWLALVALAAVAGLLSFVPVDSVTRLRDFQQAALRPAQAAGATVVQFVESRRATPSSDEGQIACQREDLEQRCRELDAAVHLAAKRLESKSDESLLSADVLPARIIGRQGRTFLEHLATVDAGRAHDVLPAAWVVDRSRPLIEQGRHSHVESGQLVLAAGRVWGQVEQVGGQTSTVRHVTSVGYRAEVSLGQPNDNSARFGPAGILEGTGASTCRVRMVPTTEAVSVGDLVFTAAGDELLPTPLVYGRITRCERPAGAVYWELWMEPAAVVEPEQVAIVRVSLNAARFAQAPAGQEARR